MGFKSYSWVIGTTSFRVNNLNYKIERQLQLLDEYWDQNPCRSWDNLSQIGYYNYLRDNGFVQGNAPRPDKDAREKTSGLVDIGVLTSDRKITEVGKYVESLINCPRNKDNIFHIDNDSYCYLLQFLKMQIWDDDFRIKPFISLIYMIEELGYLSYDEFTYLLPICRNGNDVMEMTELIRQNRVDFNIDMLISSKIFDMQNYIEALMNFKKMYPVTEKTMGYIGLNRKSESYDYCYFGVYESLVDLVFHHRNDSFLDRKLYYIRLFDSLKKMSSKAKSLWQQYLFFGYTDKTIDRKFDEKFKFLPISQVRNIQNFKEEFFTKMHVIKWKINLKEYFDLNCRYFSLTDIIKFKDDKVTLELLPKYYFKGIIRDLIKEPLLVSSDYKRVFQSHISITEISKYYTDNINSTVVKINENLGTRLTIDNVNRYVDDKRKDEFDMLINTKFSNSVLINLLKLIKKREDKKVQDYVTENANIPTIFEYILGISWYKISGMKGNILDFMNLSLDANLLPKTHAGGGMADIEYYYPKDTYPEHTLLLEATLSESTGQRHMEIEPVSRHLGESIRVTNNNDNYAIFVASELDERVILDFRNMKTRFYPKGKDEYINGLKIIPIDIDLLIAIIEGKLNYNNIYSLFDKAYNSVIPDPLWFNKEIVSGIKK